MITTLLLDVGGTMYIKNEKGQGQINPAIHQLLEHLPKNIVTLIVSDTEIFDIPLLIARDFPILEPAQVFSKKTHPWIDKTNPDTYRNICTLLHINPSECLLIDNQSDFRSAAESTGIATYGITSEEIDKVITILFHQDTLPNNTK